MKQVLDILFISSWFPNRKQPKLGNFVERHARAIALKNRVHVVHVVPDRINTEVVTTIDPERNLTTTIFYHPALRLHRWFRPYFLRKAADKALSAHDFHPDLVHLNVFHPFGAAAVDISRTLKIPMIATEHWTGYHDNTHNRISKHTQSEIISAAQHAQIICPVTQQLAQAMQNFGISGNYDVIPNVVDTELFHPAVRQKTKEIFTFLHVSSLFDVHKNVSGLLRTAANLVRSGAKFQLIIVGDGDTAPHRVYAKQLGLTNQHLEIVEAQPLDSIARYMREADAFVLFSNYENLPCVIGESLASGVPVISTRVGGISEHLNANNGILVDAGNEAELEAAMRSMLHAELEFSSREMRKYAETHFSESAISDAYDQVYRRALEMNRRD